jgi:hypothetical protein
VFWYWLFAGPALLLAALSLGGERKRAVYVARRLSEAPEYLPPASVIVPMKGEDEGLRENLAAGVLPSRAKIWRWWHNFPPAC